MKNDIQTADDPPSDPNAFFEPQKGGSIFEPDDGSLLKKGQVVFHVKDHGLAVCLKSCGINLRKDPPYLSVNVGTDAAPRIITTYNFMPSDETGQLKTQECINAWKKDIDFLSKLGDIPPDSPMHLFGVAMATWKNSLDFRDHHQRDTPFLAYAIRSKGRTIHRLVKPGSRKEEAAIRRGMKRVIQTPPKST